MPGIDKSKNYCRRREINPNRCARGSFRTKTTDKTTKIVLCCPKGKYKKGKCSVGMILQSKIKKKRKDGSCPQF